MSNVPAAFLVQRPKVPAAFCVKRPQLVRRPRQVAPEDRSRSPTHVPRVVPLPQRELQAPTPTEPAEPPPWTRMLQGKHFTVWVWGKTNAAHLEDYATSQMRLRSMILKRRKLWRGIAGFTVELSAACTTTLSGMTKQHLMNHCHEQSNLI